MAMKLLMLIAAALTISTVSLALADIGSSSAQKIDPALAEMMKGGGVDKLPVIVLLQGENERNLESLEVSFRYHLINAVAGVASPSGIRSLSENSQAKGIFLDKEAHMADAAPNITINGGTTTYPAPIVKADKLWAKGIDGKGVTVAIIDSGINKNHPDLAERVVGEKNFVGDEPTTTDLLGHGTMVAGIVAGSGAASGGKYKGVAPGASLLNVKVINKDGNGRISDIIAGIEWALDNGADVLSLSLGGMNLGETNPPVTMAADNAVDAGAVVCVAAGNRNNTRSEGVSSLIGPTQLDGDNFDLSQLGRPECGGSSSQEVLLLLLVVALPPGLVDSPGDGVKVATIGATDNRNHIAIFSGSGPTRDGRIKPTVVAPGVGVVSTVPSGLEHPNYVDIYYAKQSGTSLSTPVAAGVAALLLQADKNLTPAGVNAAMVLGADKLNNSQGEQYEEYYQGAGLLDAERSYKILKDNLSAVTPDRWAAGKWAYLPAGKGIYVGLDTSADRPQKKIYTLAPKDQDSAELVFSTNEALKDVTVEATGEVADWMTIEPLPKNLEANSQRPFGVTLTVPNGAAPGIHSGSLKITAGGEHLSSVPVSVEVAEPLELPLGRTYREGTLDGRKWSYYYIDVPLGTSDLRASLGWNDPGDLDIFLLAPTSEYYSGSQDGFHEAIDVNQPPPSGRWILAIHAKSIQGVVKYRLEVERDLVESSPKRWNAGSLLPGASVQTTVQVNNGGEALTNITYQGINQNMSHQGFEGAVGSKDFEEKSFYVPEGTSRLLVNASTQDEARGVSFLLRDPDSNEIYASVGINTLGSRDVCNPKPGKWNMWIYGYDVPQNTKEPYIVDITTYLKESWDWISAKGPSTIGNDSSARVNICISVPKDAPSRYFDGELEITASNESYQIPVCLTVSGTTIQCMKCADVLDLDKDGFFDKLSLGFGINTTSPGNYSIEGGLTDCQGNSIKWLRGTSHLSTSDVIKVDVNGRDIWKEGGCGPMKIDSLFLYNDRGDLIDLYRNSSVIDRNPKEFQPPAAFLTGNYTNSSSLSKICIGIEVRVVKPGNYTISGRLDDDQDDVMGRDSVTARLDKGNRTMTLEFNPARFIMVGKSSRLHLRDVALIYEGRELERVKDAWESDVLSPDSFGSRNTWNASTNPTGLGNVRREYGRVIIA
jgi:serine protease AprX